jgi:hypothetical protein
MSRRLLFTLVTLVAWLAAVNHCSLRLLCAADAGAGVAVCSHCVPPGSPPPAQPTVHSCCQDLRAKLAAGVEIVAPVWSELASLEWPGEIVVPRDAGALVRSREHEESPPGFLVGEVLGKSLAAHAPPLAA